MFCIIKAKRILFIMGFLLLLSCVGLCFLDLLFSQFIPSFQWSTSSTNFQRKDVGKVNLVETLYHETNVFLPSH